jgi:hypothetical protein
MRTSRDSATARAVEHVRWESGPGYAHSAKVMLPLHRPHTKATAHCDLVQSDATLLLPWS